eukprot:365622-Chlamydomonas_euryale.AAC.12
MLHSPKLASVADSSTSVGRYVARLAAVTLSPNGSKRARCSRLLRTIAFDAVSCCGLSSVRALSKFSASGPRDRGAASGGCSSSTSARTPAALEGCGASGKRLGLGQRVGRRRKDRGETHDSKAAEVFGHVSGLHHPKAAYAIPRRPTPSQGGLHHLKATYAILRRPMPSQGGLRHPKAAYTIPRRPMPSKAAYAIPRRPTPSQGGLHHPKAAYVIPRRPTPSQALRHPAAYVHWLTCWTPRDVKPGMAWRRRMGPWRGGAQSVAGGCERACE